MRTPPPPPPPPETETKPIKSVASRTPRWARHCSATWHFTVAKITQSDAFNYMLYHFLCKRGIRPARTEQFLVIFIIATWRAFGSTGQTSSTGITTVITRQVALAILLPSSVKPPNYPTGYPPVGGAANVHPVDRTIMRTLFLLRVSQQISVSAYQHTSRSA